MIPNFIFTRLIYILEELVTVIFYNPLFLYITSQFINLCTHLISFNPPMTLGSRLYQHHVADVNEGSEPWRLKQLPQVVVFSSNTVLSKPQLPHDQGPRQPVQALNLLQGNLVPKLKESVFYFTLLGCMFLGYDVLIVMHTCFLPSLLSQKLLNPSGLNWVVGGSWKLSPALLTPIQTRLPQYDGLMCDYMINVLIPFEAPCISVEQVQCDIPGSSSFQPIVRAQYIFIEWMNE